MKVVIYTRDMEPITIIDLPLWALEEGERRTFVQVALMDEVRLEPLSIEDGKSMTARCVSLQFHPIRFRDRRSWLVTTCDEELALALAPAWLPGQQRSINEYRSTIRRLSGALIDALARGPGGH